MVKILDCTTRDGGYAANWDYDEAFIQKQIDFLNENGVTYYEVGYRNFADTKGKGRFYRCMPDVLAPYCNRKNNLQIGVMTDYKRFNPDDFKGAEVDNTDFVRIAVHPEDIQSTLDAAALLYDRGYKVFVQLMDVSNIDANGYLYLYMWDRKDILESLYFADSYSLLKPSEILQYYNKFKILGYKRISFHGHNAKGFALENTLSAVTLGAYSVDTTINGVGNNGGNLDLLLLKKNMGDNG